MGFGDFLRVAAEISSTFCDYTEKKGHYKYQHINDSDGELLMACAAIYAEELDYGYLSDEQKVELRAIESLLSERGIYVSITNNNRR